MPPSKSADYNRRGDAHHPAATVSLFHPSQDFHFCKTGDSVRMMFALSAEYEMAALIASILFGFGAAVWFWMELH